MMLLLRLTGFGVLALNAEGKNTCNMIHHLVNSLTCGLILLHILVCHNCLISLCKLLVVSSELLLVCVILGRLVLI